MQKGRVSSRMKPEGAHRYYYEALAMAPHVGRTAKTPVFLASPKTLHRLPIIPPRLINLCPEAMTVMRVTKTFRVTCTLKVLVPSYPAEDAKSLVRGIVSNPERWKDAGGMEIESLDVEEPEQVG